MTAAQAAGDSPTLARLTELARESTRRLGVVEALLPAALRPVVKAGPLDGASWCLLVESSAAAAKLKQLTPALLLRLQEQGYAVNTIRVKVQGPRRP